MGNQKVLLYSGGLDSWCISKLWKPDVRLFVDVGTPSSAMERKRLPPGVVVGELPIGVYELPERNYLLPLRNLFLVVMASYYGDVICLGATGSSTHFDKTETFTGKAGELLTYLWAEVQNRQVQIVTPYRSKTKREILEEYLATVDNREEGLEKAWSESFSCYNPNDDGTECWQCSSCLKKLKVFMSCGYVPQFLR